MHTLFFAVNPLSLHYSSDAIAQKFHAIRQHILRVSSDIQSPNFNSISPADLALLLDLYDHHYLGGYIAQKLPQRSDEPLRFRLSPTMTQAGGKTIHYRKKNPNGSLSNRYEIAVASRMLFNNFEDALRDVSVGGIPCPDRLAALQRIMEHEILHLVELLEWGRSNCKTMQFRMMIGQIFGHTDPSHRLVTAREHAAVKHGVRVGSLVEFEFDGQQLIGRVNRIHTRATVLVESPRGQRYTDGRRYLKYYIPLSQLQPIPTTGEQS